LNRVCLKQKVLFFLKLEAKGSKLTKQILDEMYEESDPLPTLETDKCPAPDTTESGSLASSTATEARPRQSS